MYYMKHAVLVLALPLLQACIVGPDHEGPHWLETFLPINLTEARHTSEGEDWQNYNFDRRLGIAGPRSHYGIHPRHGIQTWKNTMYKDPITGDYRPFKNYNEYLRSMQPRP